MENSFEEETIYPSASAENIATAVDTIESSLSGFLSEDKPEVSSSGNVFTNDDGLGDVVENLHHLDVVSAKPRVGIVIGGGAIFSCLPEIPSDIIVMIDRDPFVGKWINTSAEIFRQENSPEGYKRRIFSQQNPLYVQKTSAGNIPLEQDFGAEQRYLGKKHFLSSEERYQECKHVFAAKKMIATTFDISDIAAMAKLKDALISAESEIAFANLTNVWEFTGNQLAGALRLLPFHPEAIFIHSSFAYRFRRGGHSHPEAQHKIKGLEEFIKEEEREFALYQSDRQRKT